MDMGYFRKNIDQRLNDYKLVYSSYPDGDFGSLERVIIEGRNKIAGVDIWSKGWLNIDIYDMALGEQVMNILLDPTEVQEQKEAINKLMEVLLNE